MNLRNIIATAVGIVFVHYAIKILREKALENRDINSWLYFSYHFHNNLRFLSPQTNWIFSIMPGQIRDEFIELLKLLEKLHPKTLMEIGTANGGTLFGLTRVSNQDATIISVDLYGGPFGGGYPGWKIPFYKAFASPNQKTHLIRENSHLPNTRYMIETILDERTLNFLFIDGDHTYEGVKKDFEMYAPLVSKGGVIAFHDIVPGPKEYAGEVNKFWLEIRDKYKHLEIVKDWNQGGFGIGVIYM